jgi:hypothetical protein
MNFFYKKFTQKPPECHTWYILMDQWKVMSTWHYYGSCTLVAL